MPIWSSEIKELEGLKEAIGDKLPDLGKELSQLIRYAGPFQPTLSFVRLPERTN